MELIGEDMRFVNFKDFYDRRIIIKNAFNMLSIRDRQIYKMYVYSNRLIREYMLDKIWEYLNEPFGSVYYVADDGLSVYL